MRIIVDGVFFQTYLTGIARVWWSLLTEWTRDGFAKNIVLLDRGGTMPGIPGIECIRIARHSYENLSSDHELLQAVCEQTGADLFISTYYSYPTRTRSVVIVHDMIAELAGRDLTLPMWQEKHEAIRRASAWIAVSENSKRDLRRFFPQIPLDRIAVAQGGVWPVFSPAEADRKITFLAKREITKPYFLIVGPHGVEKNTLLSLQAFMQSPARQSHILVCAGNAPKLDPMLAQAIDPNRIKLLGRLSDEDLATAYSAATALLYPSIYEGFGLPILEAMACGCPVITCRNSSIPEVAGEAAIYVDPNDPKDLARALVAVQDEATRKHLIEQGLARAKLFTWRKMADKVRAVLESV